MIDSGLNWINASSSTVARYAYAAEQRRLYIDFRSGGQGYYSNVPKPVFDAFDAATSKGSSINDHLRGNPLHPWVTVVAAPRHPRQTRITELDPHFRHQCLVCGAVRTLDEYVATMPRHKRNSDRNKFAFDCPGCGGLTRNLGEAPNRSR